MPTRNELLDFGLYRLALFNSIRIAFILVFAYIATRLIHRLIHGIHTYAVKAMLRADAGTTYEVEKRAQTVEGVLRKSLIAVVWVVAFIMILKELNFDVRPVLAGAGVVGLAIGFGAQTLVKDTFAGVFLLLDNTIRLGDVVVINGTGGLVEEINLRTTILRSEDGATHVFPNGSIAKLSNLTRDYSYAVFSVSLAYQDDPDRAIALLQEIATELRTGEPYHSAILEPLEVMGVDQLGESSVIVKARFKTLPLKQWLVGREMNRRMKKRFAEAGFATPYPTRTVQFSPTLPPELTARLKELIREVLAETHN